MIYLSKARSWAQTGLKLFDEKMIYFYNSASKFYLTRLPVTNNHTCIHPPPPLCIPEWFDCLTYLALQVWTIHQTEASFKDTFYPLCCFLLL